MSEPIDMTLPIPHNAEITLEFSPHTPTNGAGGQMAAVPAMPAPGHVSVKDATRDANGETARRLPPQQQSVPTVGKRIKAAFLQYDAERCESAEYRRKGAKIAAHWRDFAALDRVPATDINKAVRVIREELKTHRKKSKSVYGRWKTEIAGLLRDAGLFAIASTLQTALRAKDMRCAFDETERGVLSAPQFYAIVDAALAGAFDDPLDAAILLATQCISRNADYRDARPEELFDLNDGAEAALEIFHRSDRRIKTGSTLPKIVKPVSALGARVLRHWAQQTDGQSLFERLAAGGRERGGDYGNKILGQHFCAVVQRANSTAALLV